MKLSYFAVFFVILLFVLFSFTVGASAHPHFVAHPNEVIIPPHKVAPVAPH